jgi:phosphinothricin acetyltransferase
MMEGHATAIGIRDASDADLLSIVEIVNREIRESAFVWGEVPNTLEMRRDWLMKHHELEQPVLVACDDAGRVVGWASLSTFRASSGYRFTCEVSVYVAREAHRRGIGRRLVERLHERASEMGLQALVAVIDCENTASIGLFESLGYVEVGRMRDIGRKFGAWRSEVFLLRYVPATSRDE